MNKLYLSLLIVFLILPIVSANLGTFKQNECVDIKTILNTTNVTLSTLSYPDGNYIINNQQMQNIAGFTWNYTTCNTTQLGTYVYDYFDNEGNVYVNDFNITPSGNSGSSNIVFIVFIIIMLYLINLIGFFGKNIPMTILGGMALLGLGIYTINNGIIIYRDWLTNYFSYITIAWGAVSALWAGIEQIQEELN